MYSSNNCHWINFTRPIPCRLVSKSLYAAVTWSLLIIDGWSLEVCHQMFWGGYLGLVVIVRVRKGLSPILVFSLASPQCLTPPYQAFCRNKIKPIERKSNVKSAQECSEPLPPIPFPGTHLHSIGTTSSQFPCSWSQSPIIDWAPLPSTSGS